MLSPDFIFWHKSCKFTVFLCKIGTFFKENIDFPRKRRTIGIINF